MKLVSRIKKVQEDLLTLKEQCRELLTAKQVLKGFIILYLAYHFILIYGKWEIKDPLYESISGDSWSMVFEVTKRYLIQDKKREGVLFLIYIFLKYWFSEVDLAYWFNFQDLIDKARTTLVGNRTLLQQMQASVGIPLVSNSDDPAFANFNQVISDPAVCLGELHLLKIMESFMVEISYSPTNGWNELNLIERDWNLHAGTYDLWLEKYSLVPFGCHIKIEWPHCI